MENCKLTLYSIDKCGYYRRGCETPEFGTLTEIFDNLRAWAFKQGMKLGQTCTFEPTGEQVAYRTFCFDLIKDLQSGTYLLTTWNELPSSQGKMAAVKGLDPVGEAEVNLTEIPDGSIPGYATYFWILPEKEMLATLQFQHSFNGRKHLEMYLKGFLCRYDENFVVTQESAIDSTNILGYKNGSDSELRTNLYPQFNSLLYRKPGQLDFIRQNWHRVRQVIRKDTIKFSIEENRTLWQQLLKTVGVGSNNFPSDESERFQFTLNYHPSEEDVNEMIRFWENQKQESKWDDIGFKLEREEDVRWLSHSMAKTEFPLDIIRNNDEIVDTQSLLDQVLLIYPKILSLL
jgi:hypothetical protein